MKEFPESITNCPICNSLVTENELYRKDTLTESYICSKCGEEILIGKSLGIDSIQNEVCLKLSLPQNKTMDFLKSCKSLIPNFEDKSLISIRNELGTKQYFDLGTHPYAYAKELQEKGLKRKLFLIIDNRKVENESYKD